MAWPADSNAVHLDTGNAIGCRKGNRARCGFNRRSFIRTWRLGTARGETLLVHDSSASGRRDGKHSGRAVSNRDGERRGRRVTIAIRDLIAEGIGYPSWRIWIARIAVAAIGIKCQNTKCAVDGAPHRRKCTADPGARAGHCGAVSAWRVDTRRAAGSAESGDDIAGLRGEIRRRHRIVIIARGWCVVVDGNGKIGRCRVIVAINNRYGKYVGRSWIG